MKNLILQHWDGALPPWARLSGDTISAYAAQIGAEYRLILGNPLGAEFGPWAQKLHVIDAEWDAYDSVVMLDMDMVATAVGDDLFDYPGVGRLHRRAMTAVGGSATGRDNPKLYHQGAPVFFGNFVKLTRPERQALRGAFDREYVLAAGNQNRTKLHDESILHHLVHTSQALASRDVLEVPHDRFCDLPEEAHPDASLLHFCRHRKSQIATYVGTL